MSDFIDILEDKHKENNIFCNKNDLGSFSLLLALKEPELSQYLEDTFNTNLSTIDEDLILFYIKDESKLLILFKSFYPLDFVEKISLPHFCLYLDNKKTLDTLNGMFDKDENFLCINCKF